MKFVKKLPGDDHSGLPDRFTLSTLGSGGDETFDLIGTGPRGIIVEINADWTAGMPDRRRTAIGLAGKPSPGE